MSSAWAFFKRDFLVASSYKLSFALQLVRILALVPIYYYIGRLLKPDAAGIEGGSYFAFLLVGMAFLEYLSISLFTFEQSLRDSQVMGTLEIMLLAPTSLSAVLVYSSLWVYFLATIRFALYLTLGVIFGMPLQVTALPLALLVLLLSVVGFAGFGMLSASVTVVAKRGLGLNALMSLASVLGGGVLFPTRALPEWAQFLANFVPMTHALQAMRAALFEGATLADVWRQLAILIAFAALLLPAGLTCFWLAIRHTQRTGTLAQY